MKKILYIAIAVLGFTTLASCTADSGGSSLDKSPAVTIFKRATPVGFDADGTLNAQIVGNDKTEGVYVFAELKADKDEFIASNGEKAYIEMVMTDGDLVSFDETILEEYGQRETTKLIEELYGIYAVTFVPIDEDGKAGKVNNFVFDGIKWIKLADSSCVGDPAWPAALGGPGGAHEIFYNEAVPNHLKIEAIAPSNTNWCIYYKEDGSISKGREYYGGTNPFDISLEAMNGPYDIYARLSANITDSFVTFDSANRVATIQFKGLVAAYQGGTALGTFTGTDAKYVFTLTY